MARRTPRHDESSLGAIPNELTLLAMSAAWMMRCLLGHDLADVVACWLDCYRGRAPSRGYGRPLQISNNLRHNRLGL